MSDQIQFLFVLLCHYSSFYLIQAILFPCQSISPCGCSDNHVDIDPRIPGGEIVVHRSWSWAVSLRNSYNEHICGGTIISKTFILTAAHCFRKIADEPLPYSVVVGTDSLISTTRQIGIISQILIHPKWNYTTKENDIALIELDTPILIDGINLAKICLPEVTKSKRIHYPNLKSSLVAIGWGTTIWNDFISPRHLRQVILEAIDITDSKCETLIKNIHLQFCASVHGNGGKYSCQGDSGGPIMYFSPSNRRWILTGIISYGYQCDLREYAGVYTRISVYINWIKSIVGNDGIVTLPESQGFLCHTSNTSLVLLLTFLSILFF